MRQSLVLFWVKMMLIELHKSVIKFVRRLQPKDQRRILNALYKLPDGDTKQLSRRNGEYRLRIGKWRVIYEFRADVIFVMEIDSRGDIYK